MKIDGRLPRCVARSVGVVITNIKRVMLSIARDHWDLDVLDIFFGVTGFFFGIDRLFAG
jgi:hypothetical protein